jgi:hypothetical protein
MLIRREQSMSSEKSFNCYNCDKKVKWEALKIFIKGVPKVLCWDCGDNAVEIIQAGKEGK